MRIRKLMQSRRSRFIMILVGLCLVIYPVAYYMSATDITITIDDKERITTGSGEEISSKFIIYDQHEVFENTDSWLFNKWNSSDFQNKLKVNKTYRVKVAGWRIPFWSQYRNIVSIE